MEKSNNKNQLEKKKDKMKDIYDKEHRILVLYEKGETKDTRRSRADPAHIGRHKK